MALLAIGTGLTLRYGIYSPPDPPPIDSAPTPTAQPSVRPQYTIPRSIRYSFTLTNTSTRLVEGAAFWAHAPLAQTANQRLEDMTVSVPYRLVRDDQGNQHIEVQWDSLPPYATKTIQVQARLRMAQTPNRLPLPDAHPYLQAQPLIQADDPAIRRQAADLQAPTQIETARRLHRWVADNIQYAGYQRDDHGALYALRHRRGDCTEYAYLVTALARAAGIPARVLGGYVYAQDALLKPHEYHNWAELYIDGRWHLADPQRDRFDTDADQYIAMRIITPSRDGTRKSFQRFALAGDGLKARMN